MTLGSPRTHTHRQEERETQPNKHKLCVHNPVNATQFGPINIVARNVNCLLRIGWASDKPIPKNWCNSFAHWILLDFASPKNISSSTGNGNGAGDGDGSCSWWLSTHSVNTNFPPSFVLKRNEWKQEMNKQMEHFELHHAHLVCLKFETTSWNVSVHKMR